MKYQIVGNAMLAASTPELANPAQQQVKLIIFKPKILLLINLMNIQVKGYSGSEMQLYRHITKPPPPYPKNSSNSTPDLSVRKPNSVSASTPDLYQGQAAAPGVVLRQQQITHSQNYPVI